MFLGGGVAGKKSFETGFALGANVLDASESELEGGVVSRQTGGQGADGPEVKKREGG